MVVAPTRLLRRGFVVRCGGAAARSSKVVVAGLEAATMVVREEEEFAVAVNLKVFVQQCFPAWWLAHCSDGVLRWLPRW